MSEQSNADIIAIVGSGLAGVSAAGALREAGFTGRVLLIGEEPELPYDRPPLSKAALVSEEYAALEKAGPPGGALPLPDHLALRTQSWFDTHNIELRLGQRVTGIDTQAQTLGIAGQNSLHYHRLILAPGARARRLPAVEAGPTPHLYLRTLRDAALLRGQLRPGKRIVLLGGGVIGMEVAASARQRGCDVTVVELAPRIMARALIPAVSAHVAAYHEHKGVKLRLGAEVTGPAINGLALRDGAVVPADLIVVGIGVVPNVELAEAAGLQCADGIEVDEFGATSAANVFAAGDAVHYPDAFYGRSMRSENWMHAQNQAVVAAKNALGANEPYRQTPFMWSDQYDLKIQITGRCDGEQDVLRGDVAKNKFMYLHLAGGKVVGASGINEARDIKYAQRLIEARVNVDPAQLADPAFNLKKAAGG